MQPPPALVKRLDQHLARWHGHVNVESPEHVFQFCQDFARILLNDIYDEYPDAEIVDAEGYHGTLPPDAHRGWKNRSRQGGYLHIRHKAVRVGDWVLDPSGAQFGKAWPRIYPLQRFLDDWHKVVFLAKLEAFCGRCHGCPTCAQYDTVDTLIPAYVRMRDRPHPHPRPHDLPCADCGGDGQLLADVRFRFTPNEPWTVWHKTPAHDAFVSAYAPLGIRLELRDLPRGAMIYTE